MSGLPEGVRSIRRGKVWLVGAGPGDPELLTVRAHRLPIVERALEGHDVVRLKGGDPFIFGRGGEEAEELAVARVPFEVVPGISAALGAAAAAGLPLTHRECAASVTLVTAHAAHGGQAGDGEREGQPDLFATVPREGTLVFYMGLARIEATCAALVALGRSPATPAAVLSKATLPDARIVTGTIADIAARVRDANIEPPALLVVGEVVAHRVESCVESPAVTEYGDAQQAAR